MKNCYNNLLLFLTALTILSCESTKEEYLLANRMDLNDSTFVFPQSDFSILGFGAYHGSAKTELVELAFLESLIQQKTISYFIPVVCNSFC